ncbi:hypothetical protein LNAOJCKE_4784 [Methylorubrum aminovorans]|uniref:Uncharacterized protein n=2 Tax=Methylorubrum aminovorans TaxID=269069 RepID=A0ABQ4UMG4_9HYPH|nr:hypothetical protein LNAOJCKE_4784 [Methylorubrum aminovorans]
MLSEPALPSPGSPEAIAAWRAACTEFDRRTHIGDDEFNRLRIGDTVALWTPDKVRSAISSDFSGAASSDEALAMARQTRAELQDLLVLTIRRDLRFEEAARDTRIHEMFELAYPDEVAPPADVDAEEGADPILAVIANHKAAYAAWLPHLRAVSETLQTDPAFTALEAAAEAPEKREADAYASLAEVSPTTLAGLVALADYLPGALLRNAVVGADNDAMKALSAMCSAVKALLGDDIGLNAALHERRARADEFLSEMERDGFLPYPADNPRCLLATNYAIRYEAERLLAIAQSAYDRRANAYAGFPTAERDRHLKRLRAEYRLDQLAAVVHESPIAPSKLTDEILASWREWANDPGHFDEEENEATRALSEKRYALIDAAEALPATQENLPAKTLALAWLEYVDLWRNGQARDEYGTDGRLALDIDTAISGRTLLKGY